MEPLREVFDRLAAGKPGEVTGDLGALGDLAPELVAEALVGYADTAPIEVAEHLQPFVTEATGPAGVDAADVVAGLDLLASAPEPGGAELTEALLPSVEATDDQHPAEPDAPGTPDQHHGLDLGFGTGTTEIPLPEDAPAPGEVAQEASTAAGDSLAEPIPFEERPAEWLELDPLTGSAEEESGDEPDDAGSGG